MQKSMLVKLAFVAAALFGASQYAAAKTKEKSPVKSPVTHGECHKLASGAFLC